MMNLVPLLTATFFVGRGGGGGFEQKLSHVGANTTFGVHYDISFINLMC